MAVVKEENVRDRYNSTLDEIYQKIKIRLRKDSLEKKVVIKGGRPIGYLAFIKGREKVIRRCYAVSMVVDKTEVEYIYDEKGDRISIVWELGDNIFVSNDSDIKLEREILLNSIRPYQDTENDNQGRHISNEQERMMSSDKSVLKNNDIENNEIDSNASMYESDGNIPINWATNGITLKESAATVNLRNRYNGRAIKDLFNFPDNLKNKLPAGVSLSDLNHIGLVDSSALTEKDGKKRETELTFVVVDDVKNPKYMVELDYLKPQEKLSKQEDIMADKTSIRYGDGETQKGASTTTDVRSVFTVEIPNAGRNIGQTNDYITLEVRYNPNYIDTSTSQKNDANNIEIHLGVQDISKSQYIQQHRQNKVSFKLEGDNENYNKIEQFYQRREFENFEGPDDEYKYSVNKKQGESRDAYERDERDVNSKMGQEEQEHKKNVNKQYEKNEQTTAEVASQVNERKLAEDIINDPTNPYGISDYEYIDKQIKITKAIMESKNEKVDYETLKSRVTQQIDQKVPGDFRRRAV